jgi:uncharacterized protein YggU (UPF0235/DUF167 family)
MGFHGLIPISDHPLGATFPIRVQSRAARTAITGTVGDALPRSAVQVVAGQRSRNKIVRIAGCRGAEVQRKLREHFTV